MIEIHQREVEKKKPDLSLPEGKREADYYARTISQWSAAVKFPNPLPDGC